MAENERFYTDEQRTRALVVYLDNDGDIEKSSKQMNIPKTVLKSWETKYDWPVLRAQVANRIKDEIVEDVVARRQRNIKVLDFAKGRLIKQIRDGLRAKNLENAVETLGKIVELEHKLLADPNTNPQDKKNETNLFVMLGKEIKGEDFGDNPFDDTEGDESKPN